MSREVHEGFSGAGMLLVFAAGVAAGAVAALLVAPRSGAETRKKILEAARKPKELATHMPEAIHQARVAAKEAFNKSLAEKH